MSRFDFRRRRSAVRALCALVAAAFLPATAAAAPRDVQLRRILVVEQIVEIHNSSAEAIDLESWQFCTHDDDEVFQYAGFSTMARSVIVPAGGSIWMHLLNDAPPRDGTRFNASELRGGFAGPIDTGPYGMSLYFPPVDFDDGATMADHVQWSIGGLDGGLAGERADEAVAGGLWTAVTDWVATTERTVEIVLLDTTGGALHGPASYAAVDADDDTLSSAVAALREAMSAAVADLDPCLQDRACVDFKASVKLAKGLASADRLLAKLEPELPAARDSVAVKRLAGAVGKVVKAAAGGGLLGEEIDAIVAGAFDRVDALGELVGAQSEQGCEVPQSAADRLGAKIDAARDLAFALDASGDAAGALKALAKAAKLYEAGSRFLEKLGCELP